MRPVKHSKSACGLTSHNEDNVAINCMESIFVHADGICPFLEKSLTYSSEYSESKIGAPADSLILLENTDSAVQNGVYNEAIVGTCNHGHHLHSPSQFIGTSDSKRKSLLYKITNNFGKSEIIVLFLQNKANISRIYALLAHVKGNLSDTTELERPMVVLRFSKEREMMPSILKYNDTCIYRAQVGHFNELKFLEEICSKRKRLLGISFIESIDGRAGHFPCLRSIIRTIAFQHNRQIAITRKPVMSYGNRNSITSFRPKRNSSRDLLTSNSKTKNMNHVPSSDYWPRLIVSSGFAEEHVDTVLSDLERNKFDAEYIQLASDAYKDDIPGHKYRGYAVLKKEDTIAHKHIKMSPKKKSPVCFYFGGNGAQWSGMGNALKNLPVFWNTIQRCHKVLEPKGVNLIQMITDDDPEIFESSKIVNLTVGQTAIQIALCDVLTSVGIVPDYICGCSLGEVASGYADGCLTTEQAILVAYYSGLVSTETTYIQISKMFVGTEFDAIRHFLPPEIDVAVYFGPGGCVIGGPAEIVQNFSKSLRDKGIYFKEPVPSLYPVHTPYFAPTRPLLLNYIKNVIPEPKLRSKKWISTSSLETEWNTEEAMYASAEYYTNYVHKPFYFQQAIHHLPENTVMIEIAPHHGCTQRHLKLAAVDIPVIPLMRKDCDDGVEFLLYALGKIYETGANLQINKLYPPGEFPVSRVHQKDLTTA